MKINTHSKKLGKQGYLKGIFILAFTLECILIGILIVGRFGSNTTLPRPLSANEVGHYKKYSIYLPNTEGGKPSAAEVLSYCTFQEQKTIGDAQYTFYTSDALSQYIYRCGTIREIMKTSEGTIYITYTSQDADDVFLTLDDSGILRKSIYTEKTDTYYTLSELENYKYLHFRHPHSSSPYLVILAVGIGFGLIFFFVRYIKGRRKRAKRNEGYHV